MKTATPHTLCARCGKPGHAHPQFHRTGKRAGWHADHLVPSDNAGPLALSWSICNLRHGAGLTNEKRWGRNGGPPAGWTPGPHLPLHYDLRNPQAPTAAPCLAHSGKLCPTCASYLSANPSHR